MVLDHGFPADFQGVSVAIAGEIGKMQFLPPLEGFDRRAGRDASEQRHARPRALAFLQELGAEFERPALVEAALQVALVLKRGDVLVHGGERCQLQPVRDFVVAGAISLLIPEVGNQVEQLPLPFGQRHRWISSILWAKKKGKARERKTATTIWRPSARSGNFFVKVFALRADSGK